LGGLAECGKCDARERRGLPAWIPHALELLNRRAISVLVPIRQLIELRQFL
jgi:hypothetical protein